MTLNDILAASGPATAHLDPVGLAGMALGIAASLMRRRAAILLTGAGAGACLGLHYLGLGSATGAGLCFVSVAQNLSSARFAADGAPRWLVAAFALSAAVALGIAGSTWAGWPSACAAAGMLLSTTARLQADPNRMRALFIACTACWCGHDLGVGSLPGLACQAMTLAGFVLALVRATRAGTASEPGQTVAPPRRRPGRVARTAALRPVRSAPGIARLGRRRRRAVL